MQKPLKTPNVPSGKVKSVAVSDYSDDLIKQLIEFDIEPIITIKNNLLDDKINYHTDMLILNIKQGILIADESQSNNFVKYLTKGYELKKLNKRVKSPYPDDSLLNCVVLGNKLICNKKSISTEVLQIAEQYDVVNVNQGYSKCSVCVVNNNALITDDESIYSASQLNQIDSILISKGSVKLNGFDYGFIGGCTGLIDKNKMLFNGDINYHNDCNKIIDFLNKYKVEPVIIENRPLVDIGSIIPITEETA